MSDRPVPAVLSIAGSDSGGGAGIQADLKAFARCGVHGMTAIAALTAQNTVGVTGVHPVPGDFIVAQVQAVAEDIGVDAVKIGMLGTAETVRAVREALELLEPDTPVVLDPVMVAESGAVLLDEPARAAIVEELLPRATVITPNVPEARVLAGAGEGGEPDGGDVECAGAAAARPRPGGGGGDRRSSGRGDGPVLRRRRGSSGSRASGIRTALRTAPAARTRPRSPPTWRSATARSRPRGRRGGSPARRCGTASAASVPAPVRWTSSR